MLPKLDNLENKPIVTYDTCMEIQYHDGKVSATVMIPV